MHFLCPKKRRRTAPKPSGGLATRPEGAEARKTAHRRPQGHSAPGTPRQPDRFPPDPMWPNAGHVAPFHRALGFHPWLAPLHRRHFARMTVEIIEGGVDHRALTRETAHTRPLLDACAPRLTAEPLHGLGTTTDDGRPDTVRRARMTAGSTGTARK